MYGILKDDTCIFCLVLQLLFPKLSLIGLSIHSTPLAVDFNLSHQGDSDKDGVRVFFIKIKYTFANKSLQNLHFNDKMLTVQNIDKRLSFVNSNVR